MSDPSVPEESQHQTVHGDVGLDSDDALAERVSSDRGAFAVLYDRYYGPILNYAFRCTLNAATAEELTGTTFLKALQAIAAYQPSPSLKAWLYQIATNEIRMHFRSRRRRPMDFWREEDLDRVSFQHSGASTDDLEEQLRSFEQARALILALPERYRSVLMLRYFEGLTVPEIAAIVEKKEGTVKSQISRGLAMLREQLGASTIPGRNHGRR